MSDTLKPLKVVFLDRATIPPYVDLKPLPFPHEIVVFQQTSADEVSDRIRDAEIVITNKTTITSADLAQARKLRFIAIAATGTDNVDIGVCDDRRIGVSNIRNYATTTVPEHTFALIFALRRSLVAYRDSVQAGRWREAAQFCFFDHPIRDLKDSTIGIIGDGALGRATAQIANALGMRVLMSAFKGRSDMGMLYTPFEKVLAESDIITLHCPLIAETKGLIGEAEFSQMVRRPVIINTARGGLVDETALIRALLSGQIAGAGFDVVTREPLPIGHPFEKILNHPAFILTPHVAWASAEAIQALADQLVENITLFVGGSPRNLVTSF